jgi:hypothetical protein
LLEGDLQHPAMAPVKDWFEREVPGDLRSTPALPDDHKEAQG